MYKTYRKFDIGVNPSDLTKFYLKCDNIELEISPSDVMHVDKHLFYNSSVFLEMESCFIDKPKLHNGFIHVLSTTTKYCWLNLIDGTFSNSWNEVDHEKFVDSYLIECANNNGTKLIKFECVNDNNFEFNCLMKLK